MTIIALVFTALSRVAAFAGELVIQKFGTFNFPRVNIQDIVCNPDEEFTITANSVPWFEVTDTTNSNQGWSVAFYCQPLENELHSNHLSLKYNQAGAQVIKGTIGSQDVFPYTGGPRIEKNILSDLSDGQIVLNTYPGYGKGTYNFIPASNDFKVVVTPENALNGTYRGIFVVTLFSGPSGKGTWQGIIE